MVTHLFWSRTTSLSWCYSDQPRQLLLWRPTGLRDGPWHLASTNTPLSTGKHATTAMQMLSAASPWDQMPDLMRRKTMQMWTQSASSRLSACSWTPQIREQWPRSRPRIQSLPMWCASHAKVGHPRIEERDQRMTTLRIFESWQCHCPQLTGAFCTAPDWSFLTAWGPRYCSFFTWDTSGCSGWSNLHALQSTGQE